MDIWVDSVYVHSFSTVEFEVIEATDCPIQRVRVVLDGMAHFNWAIDKLSRRDYLASLKW